MIDQQSLTIVALCVSILSMLLSIVALWPQWRDQFALLRDFVLWGALAIVAAGIFHAAWRRSSNPNTAVLQSDFSRELASGFANDFSKVSTARPSDVRPKINPLAFDGNPRDFLAPIVRSD